MDFHKVQWIPACGDTLFRVNSLMRKSVLPHADVHEKRWISQDEEIHQTLIFRIWGFTLTIVWATCGNAPKNAYIRCADIHNFWCITACGDTQFNVNSFTRKSVFPRTRICTVLSELLHVEIHKSMCKSAHGEIRFSTCGYSHKFVYFHMRRCTQNWEFSNTVHSNLNVVNTELLMEAQVILSISGDCSYKFIIWNTFILRYYSPSV